MIRYFLTRRPSALFPRLYETPTHSSPTGALPFASQAGNNQEGSTESATNSVHTPSDQAPSTDGSTQQDESLTTEQQLERLLEEKENKIAELNDRTLRVLAEMENVRMIARRDVDNAKRYAIAPFANSLLSVADNLGLALKAVPQEALDDPNNQQLKGLFVGVGATEAELLKVFAKHGITRFGDVGDKFDPNRYQALFEAPMAEHEPGTVIDVSKLGYALGDRILRPAEVGVSRAP